MNYKWKFNLFNIKSLIFFSTFFLLNIPVSHADNIDSLYLSEQFESSLEFFQDGKYENAIEQLEMILKLKRKIDTDITPKYYMIYNKLGTLFSCQGNFQKAVYFYKKALNTDDTNYISGIYMNLGIVYSSLGDFTKSINYHQLALNLSNSKTGINLVKTMNIYHNLGYTYLNAKQYENSLLNFLKCIQIAKENNISDIELTYLNTALVYQRLKRLEEASKYYKLSIKYYDNKYKKDYYITAIARMYYASLLAEKHNFEKALELIDNAYRTLSESLGAKHPYTSECLETTGDIWFKRQHYKNAVKYYHKALIARVKNFNDTSIFSNPVKTVFPDIDLIDLLKAKALAFERLANTENKKRNLEAALSTYEMAAYFIGKLRTGYLSEESKLYISSNKYETHLSVIRIAVSLYELTSEEKYRNTAFEYAERSKYGVLHELVNDEKARGFAGVPDSITDRERKLKEQINNYRLLVSEQIKGESPDTGKVSMLNSKIFGLSRQQEELIREMENNYPAYYRLKYNDDVISPAGIKNVLDPCEVLVEYVLSDSLLYTFLCTRDTFCLNTQFIDSSFYKSLKFYNEFLHSEYMLGYDSFRMASYTLYKALVAPVEPYLRNKCLLIVPDIRMSLMAFESLIDEPYTNDHLPDYSKEHYLVRKYPVGYAFSATLLAGSKQKEKKHFPRFLGFAPGYSSADSLDDFPQAFKRLRQTARMLLGRSYTGKYATESNFKKNAKDYDILHFFAHGKDDESTPSLSRIYMSSSKDSAEDGLLYAYEISNLSINPDLVVLASCYSGSGTLSQGEGVLSMGRAFFNAGSKSLIISLWGAPVEPALQELAVFYKQLLSGKRKDEALQAAKLKYLENSDPINAQPRAWANLVIIGNQDALYIKGLFKILILTVFIFFLIILLFIFRKRISKLF